MEIIKSTFRWQLFVQLFLIELMLFTFSYFLFSGAPTGLYIFLVLLFTFIPFLFIRNIKTIIITPSEIVLRYPLLRKEKRVKFSLIKSTFTFHTQLDKSTNRIENFAFETKKERYSFSKEEFANYAELKKVIYEIRSKS